MISYLILYQCRNSMQILKRIYILMQISKKLISLSSARFQRLQTAITTNNSQSKFHQLPMLLKRQYIQEKYQIQLDHKLLNQGGLSLDTADTIIQNVIGIQSLPLSFVPNFVINGKITPILMSVEEPSIVAACSAIAKIISPYSFQASSTPNIMIGQIHLPNSQKNQIYHILSKKQEFIKSLNEECVSMVKRGGGVVDIKINKLSGEDEYVVNIHVDVCEAMGANIVNTIAERGKYLISQMGMQTGIAILSNYCTERKSKSSFEIPVSAMGWKKYDGVTVVKKIIQAYQFAKHDVHRAVTHNKGIMNGIDSVCIATGQDWRAVESAAHCYACRNGKYEPLTHFEVVEREGIQYFRGTLEIPISVGTLGGAINKNPIYKSNLALMGNPSSNQLAQIIVSVGLAQNLAALRALSTEGIQKGHMNLHNRANSVNLESNNELKLSINQVSQQKDKYSINGFDRKAKL